VIRLIMSSWPLKRDFTARFRSRIFVFTDDINNTLCDKVYKTSIAITSFTRSGDVYMPAFRISEYDTLDANIVAAQSYIGNDWTAAY
jgi:hypothetical protein